MPATSSPSDLAGEIDAALRAAGDPARAEGERAYLKSSLQHYGTSVPAVRKVAKTVGRLGHDQLVALVETLWDDVVYERRAVCVELLAASNPSLRVDDAPLLERLLRESGTWALVDALAASVVGALVERDPDGWAPILDRWAADADFWLRRSALLALLVPLRRGGGDFARFARYADAMLDEREFFIRKAIGWVLRDTAKKRPDLVFDWLLPRAARASSITIREAVKPLSEEQRAAISTARAAPPRDRAGPRGGSGRSPARGSTAPVRR